MQITQSNAIEFIRSLEIDSIDLVLTDPPYFLDKLDNNWKPDKLNFVTKKQQVTSLPGGMKFDPEQGRKFYNWYSEISQEIHRVMKPGAFFFSFSAPRLYHRMACAVEDAGFLIRDCFIWLYTQSQPKAMSLNHFIRKMNCSDELKHDFMRKIEGWKTPQIKSCFEPICVAQKKLDGTFLNNFLTHEVGLFNVQAKVGNQMFPANCMTDEEMDATLDKYFLIPKPDKKEKGTNNHHKTVKSVTLCEHLIKLTTPEKATVFDPFMGSGTTGVACARTGRKFVGCDINEEYVKIAKERIFEE